MEMSKKPTAKPRIAPAASPFSASVEREELERAFLLPSTTTSSATSVSHNPNNFVPTAVPITNDNSYIMSSAPVAVATIASLPPPPSSQSQSQSYSRSSRTTNSTTTANAQRTTTNKFEKSESDLDGEVIVRTEPPASSSSYNTSYDTTYDDGSTRTRPTAPPLPYESNLPSAQQQHTRSQLRAANATGAMASEEEMAGVARAQRRAPSSIPHRTLKNANAKAARKAGRADEGLKVDGEMNYTEEENEKEKEARDCLYGANKKEGKGGYEVKEYDVAEYDTFEYDVTEYKSVYD